jgi:hypothetical protein
MDGMLQWFQEDCSWKKSDLVAYAEILGDLTITLQHSCDYRAIGGMKPWIVIHGVAPDGTKVAIHPDGTFKTDKPHKWHNYAHAGFLAEDIGMAAVHKRISEEVANAQ